MATYEVRLPISGTAFLTVEAASEEDAIQAALVDVDKTHIETWTAMAKIVQGNIFYGECNEASAQRIDEGDDAAA